MESVDVFSFQNVSQFLTIRPGDVSVDNMCVEPVGVHDPESAGPELHRKQASTREHRLTGDVGAVRQVLADQTLLIIVVNDDNSPRPS